MNSKDIIQQNRFYLKARLLPTLIGLIPIVWTVFIIVRNYKEQLSAIYDFLPWLTGLGVSTALMFLLVHVNRFISKELFQKLYFKDELYMPTTDILLYKDVTFSRNIKSSIRRKIKNRFEVSLPSEKDEIDSEEEARKRIIDIVPLIRNSLRGNKLLLQHLTEYNFMRNLIGASVVAVLFAIIALIISLCYGAKGYTYMSVFFLFCYLLPLVLSKIIIKRHGKYYAKTLYQQFLTL